MLILTSSWSISQTSNTVPLSRAQVTELYKISKQNDFLKELTAKQEKQINDAAKLITEQKGTISRYSEMSSAKDDLLNNFRFQCEQENTKRDIEIQRLKDIAVVEKKLAKKDSRKKFWSGVGYGGAGVVVLGVAGIILLK